MSPTDSNKLIRKFNPTIFDSIAIATAVADQEGLSLAPGEPEANRRRLLDDAKYHDAISQETMRTTSISARTNLALSYLYGNGHEE